MKGEQFLHDGTRWMHVKVEWDSDSDEFPVIYIDDRRLNSIEDIKKEREGSNSNNIMQTMLMMQMLGALKGNNANSKDESDTMISKLIEALQAILKEKKEKADGKS